LVNGSPAAVKIFVRKKCLILMKQMKGVGATEMTQREEIW